MPRRKKQPKLEEPVNQMLEVEQKEEQPMQEVDNNVKEVEQKEDKPMEEVTSELTEPETNLEDEEVSEDEDTNDDEELENISNERKKMESVLHLWEAKQLLEHAKDARRKYDRDWLSRDLFRRGYQFVNHNANSGVISLTSTSQARIPVNLTWAYMRSIVNQVTSFQPKWEVLPEFKGKKAERDARLAGKLLDFIFKVNNLSKKIKELVIQGLIYSVGGPLEVYWDDNFDNGPHQPKGQLVVILHDPYDVYIDPDAKELGEAEYVIKAVRTSLDKIKNNESYDEKVRQRIPEASSSKKAESEYKQFLIQTIQSGTNINSESHGVILYELQRKERDGNNVKIRYLTWVDEIDTPLRNELVDQEDFNMEMYQADQNPLELYGESWAKHVIALNRVVNHLESSLFDYHYRFAKGRLIIDKNSGVSIVTNEHGSIIEANRGARVAGLPIPALPNSYETQIMRLTSRMEDISGVHEASLGRGPSSVKSGIGIAELKQSDQTNQDDLVQNLERMLERLGSKILNLIADHYDTPRILKVVGTGRMVEHFAVVGADYVSEDKENWKYKDEKYPLAHIAKNNELNVQIGSWLAYSKEAQQKTLMDMAKAGIIAKEDLLKYMEFPNIQDVVNNARIEQIVELKRKEEQAMPSGVTQEQLALAENEMLRNGTPAPVDPEQDDHELHIAIHLKAMDEEGDNNTIAGHIREHRRAQKGGGEMIPAQTPQGSLAPGEAPQAMPQLPPGAMPMPPSPMGQGGQPPMMEAAPAPPPASYFSAGIQELPPTASSIIGGAGNILPVG